MTKDQTIDMLYSRIHTMRAMLEQCETLFSIITDNATMIPDPAMGGSTDTYSVPLDDVSAARRMPFLIDACILSTKGQP